MLKTDLINEVQKQEYKNICKKILPQYWQDLYQELVITILEYNEEKISRINNINGARFFLVGIILNMAQSNTSAFYRKYRKPLPADLDLDTHLNPIDKEANEIEDSQKIEKVVSEFNNLYWFDKYVFNRYIEEGSIRKVESSESINRGVVQNIIKDVKKKIHTRMNPIKILLVTQNEDNALKYHRQLSPHWRLAKVDPQFDITKIKSEGERVEATIDFLTDELLSTFDIVYYLRQISFTNGKVKDTIDRCHKCGCKVILDIDDYWKLNSQHFMYQTYKQNNVTEETELAIKLVDHVITTTDYFAGIIRKFNPNVTVLPNCISPDAEQFTEKPIENGRVRFGWIGGVYHRADIEAIAENFCRIAKDNQIRDSYQICLGGFNAIGPGVPNPEYKSIETTMTCNYEFRNYDSTYTSYLFTYTPTMEHISYDKPYRRLWAKDVYSYGELYNEIDVALVPLNPYKFNACKSELKLVEAGTMGKAVIVSDVEPYSKWIRNGVNGLKINPNRNSIDWYLAMKKLIREPELRKDLAEGLRETIKKNFNMDSHNKTRAELYRSLI